jgi:hypothetical protein
MAHFGRLGNGKPQIASIPGGPPGKARGQAWPPDEDRPAASGPEPPKSGAPRLVFFVRRVATDTLFPTNLSRVRRKRRLAGRCVSPWAWLAGPIPPGMGFFRFGTTLVLFSMTQPPGRAAGRVKPPPARSPPSQIAYRFFALASGDGNDVVAHNVVSVLAVGLSCPWPARGEARPVPSGFSRKSQVDDCPDRPLGPSTLGRGPLPA